MKFHRTPKRSGRRRWPSKVLLASLVFVAACAEAGGDVKGGNLTDAGASASTPAPSAPASGVEIENVGSGTKWSDLYRDLFGPTGRPGSCSFQSSCHGSPDGAGAQSGSGIECFDVKRCRQSLFDKRVLRPTDSAAPEKSGLFLGLLRVRNAEGNVVGFMPKAPAEAVFPPASIERIQTWIRDGMQDD